MLFRSMIYSSLQSRAKIRQGDIFWDIPKVIYDPTEIIETIDDKWEVQEVTFKDTPIKAAITKIVPVPGIVVSQDCDNVRKQHIQFAEIFIAICICSKEIGIIFFNSFRMPDTCSSTDFISSILIFASPKAFSILFGG